jgi:hypothetical protein
LQKKCKKAHKNAKEIKNVIKKKIQKLCKYYLQVEDFSEFGQGKKLGARNRRVYPL